MRITALRNRGSAGDKATKNQDPVQRDHLKMNRCPCYFTNGTIEMQKEEVEFAGAQESEDDSLPFVFVCGS